MNPLTEYQRRHKTLSIPVCHNGVCFFNQNEIPSLIATTSLSCKPFSTCIGCKSEIPNVIIEIMHSNSVGNFTLISHIHVDPSTDLLSVVRKYGKYEPVYVNSKHELEFWLWDFCTKTLISPNRSKETGKSKKIENMIIGLQKYSKYYLAFYNTYEALLASRKYLLFE